MQSSTPPEHRAKPLVRLKQIDKIYANGTIALRQLDLDIGRHEFVSLLGPSGCGKSTALRIVAGLGSASGGSIDWPGAVGDTDRNDTAARESGAARRELGFVFQEPNLMPWATTFDNVFLPLKLKGQSRQAARSRVTAVLQMVGLSRFANAYPRELSGGMRMRVSIARALVTDPTLLLMDEPFAALDEITRNKVSNDLLEIWQASRCTVLFVTHSVYESVFLSSRIVVMAAQPGRIVGELQISAPYPRNAAFRLSTEYTEYCREVSALLASAMQS